MNNVVGWEIFYGNGSVYTSKMGAWEQAPNNDVQNIVIVYDGLTKWSTHRTSLVNCRDYYYLDYFGHPQATNDISLLNNKVILYGKWMTDEDFNKNLSIAFARANNIVSGEYGY